MRRKELLELLLALCNTPIRVHGKAITTSLSNPGNNIMFYCNRLRILFARAVTCLGAMSVSRATKGNLPSNINACTGSNCRQKRD